MKDKTIQHVAIIPDGNRRWADMHNLPHYQGHRAGAERMDQVVDALISRGLKCLTVWGFSSDNWKRSPEEVSTIFHLLQLWIEKDTPWLHEKGVKLRHIGRLHQLPQGLQDAITRSIALTCQNTGMILNLAFNYTGRAEIIDAVRQLIREGVPWPMVDESLFGHYLYTNGMPDVDLVIRTADEFRPSNFMLWQTAYCEYYVTPVFWPDFDSLELEKALKAFERRERRFGGD